MYKATVAEDIRLDAQAISSDESILEYSVDLRVNGRASAHWNNARFVLDRPRDEFVNTYETRLTELCQKGDVLARIYTGYDQITGDMPLWPSDQRAQVLYLVGYAALEGSRVPNDELMLLLL